jgi:hypothetical protein
VRVSHHDECEHPIIALTNEQDHVRVLYAELDEKDDHIVGDERETLTLLKTTEEGVVVSDGISRTRSDRRPCSPLHPDANVRPRQIPSLKALEPSQLPFTLSDPEALLQASHIGLDVVALPATSQEQQGRPGLVRATFLHEPPWRLR